VCVHDPTRYPRVGSGKIFYGYGYVCSCAWTWRCQWYQYQFWHRNAKFVQIDDCFRLKLRIILYSQKSEVHDIYSVVRHVEDAKFIKH